MAPPQHDLIATPGVAAAAVAAAAAAAVVLLLASPAAGSRAYSGVVEERLGTPCAPACTLCHGDSTGGNGTVVKPLGRALLDAGALPNDEASLRAALAAVDAAAIDSDGDGTGDVDELEAGRDPNVAGEGELCAVTYGCGARVAVTAVGRDAPSLYAVLWGGALVWLRARRAGRRPRT